MSDFKPLPPKVAEKLGQLMYAGFYTNPETVALSEGATAVRVKSTDLAWALDMARKCAAADSPDAALSAPAPRWNTAPTPAPKSDSRPFVLKESPDMVRARKIREHDAVREFEAKYGRGATLDDAKEQDLVNDFLRQHGMGVER